jgi:hypothetical protein
VARWVTQPQKTIYRGLLPLSAYSVKVKPATSQAGFGWWHWLANSTLYVLATHLLMASLLP